MSFNRKMASEMKVSVVVVGDSKIGKTALIRQFTNKIFTEVRRIMIISNVFIDNFLRNQLFILCTKTGYKTC